MPGMNSGGLNPASSILVSAFHSALLHQALIVLLIFVLLLIAWGATRTAIFGGKAFSKSAPGAATAAWREPRARQVLRIGFGVIWVFDGILQAQPQMAGGMPAQVLQPAADGSPGWVQSMVNWGANLWGYHPIEAAAATVWIQVGIGLWLILGARGWNSRIAGLSSVAWGLIVWSFGEAFGGIFAPGLTVLFGAPGAVLIYAVAGALVALPERAWDGTRLGRLVLAGMGVFFLGMALLQAWPGRGFWQGTLHGQPGSLAGMVQSMASTPQPHVFEAIVSGFGSFAQSHGFAVNLVAVLALAAIGAGFVAGAVRADIRLTRIVVIVGAVFCLADWLLVEDLGVFGGLSTDPNSMIPLILLFTAGFLALTPTEQPATVAEEAEEAEEADRPAYVPARLSLSGTARGFAGFSARAVAGLGALGVILVGAAPMAFATTNKTADPITAESIAGDSEQINTPAPNFTLTSQDGRTVSLSSLRGKTVLLTFLDPVCTSDCPMIAQEMRSADTLLGNNAAKTELVAVVANPTYNSIAYTRAFTNQEDLSQVPNWLYLTGSVSQLDTVWHHFGIEVEDLPAGAMAAHNDVAFVISATGEEQQEISSDPGPATTVTLASFASLMADAVLQSMGQAK